MVCRWDSCNPAMYAPDHAPDPAVTQPRAASPKAPSRGTAGSYLSLSSAETLTPESGAGGRPSRASAVDTVTPESRRVGTGSPESRAGADVGIDRLQVLGKVSLENSTSGATLADIVDGSARHIGVGRGPAGRRRSGELRRRKYSALSTPDSISLQLSRQHTAGSQEAPSLKVKAGFLSPEAQQGRATATATGTPASSVAATGGASSAGESDDCEVLIEGPLQQRHLLVFWRWRWCVLDRRELRIYRNEEASLLMPEKPLERRIVASMTVGPDLNFPSVLICADSRTGEPMSFLRAGPGLRWEEVAASTLWLGAFTAVSRSVARQRGSRLARQSSQSADKPVAR
mmetsp:Transcript_71256/g.159532  ORF Transcript_71256/g.159532 Transcript_71256/m.159532 type:complete len:344 (+) Transcript_71256:43-1074(+)